MHLSSTVASQISKGHVRYPYIEHFLKNVPCTYSMTAELDISHLMKLKQQHGLKLYPMLIYVLTKTVNQKELSAFRCALETKEPKETKEVNDSAKSSDYVVNVYEQLHPSYTIFHADTETFSSLITSFQDDFQSFYQSCVFDINKYKDTEGLAPQQIDLQNILCISILPWTTFTAFNLNLDPNAKFLLPIATFGKYYQKDQKYFIPLAVQVHHAVCDGFHVGLLYEKLQQNINALQIN